MNKTEYQGLPLTPATSQRLIQEIFSGKIARRQDIIDGVVRLYRERGGDVDGSSNPTFTIKKALQLLKEAGSASNPQTGYWSFEGDTWTGDESVAVEESEGMIPRAADEDDSRDNKNQPVAERIIGEGKDCVYVYYYAAYRRLAESNGDRVWPCKIGMSERDPLLRILSQGATAMPEPPIVALIVRTNNASALEKAVHYILTVRGKVADSRGTEWFLTNVDEIEKIIHWVVQDT